MTIPEDAGYPDLLDRWARNSECDRPTRNDCRDELAQLIEDGSAVRCSECESVVWEWFALTIDGADYCPECV